MRIWLAKTFIVLIAIVGIAGYALNAQPALPPEVPPYTYSKTGSISPGILFLSVSPPSPGDWPSTILMADENGHLIFYMDRNEEVAPPYAFIRLTDFRLQNDGMMCFNGPDSSGAPRYFRMDSNFVFADTFDCSFAYELNAHELKRTEAGTYLYFCDTERLADLSGAMTNTGIAGSPFGTVKTQYIVETDSAHNVIWTWDPLLYISPSDINSAYFSDPFWMDLTHYNSLDVDANGNILVSSRHLDEITLISKPSGKIIWRMGGKRNEFFLLGDSLWFTAQHYANFMPDGNIALFDNATETPFGVARGMEIQVDTIGMTATVINTVPNSFGSKSEWMGSYQVLPDSHQLINWAGVLPFSTTISVEEFAADNTPVMQLDLPNGWVSYRVEKHPLPWSLPRPLIDCNQDSLTLTAPAGYAHYYWSTGDSGMTVAIADTGWYQVWVDHGLGRLSSEPFHVSNLASPCEIVARDEIHETGVQLFPNPADETVQFLSSNPGEEGNLTLTDITGRIILSANVRAGATPAVLNLKEIPAGVYLLFFTGNAGNKAQKLVIQHN